MDNVQVDVRKLQLLNDRICQTIDALQQVRQTAQTTGVGHPTALPFSPFGQVSGGMPNAYGLSHTGIVDPILAARQAALYGAAQAFSPFNPIMGQGAVGLGHSPWIDPSFTAQRAALYGSVVPGFGLSHTSHVDPMIADRWSSLYGVGLTSPIGAVDPSRVGLGHTSYVPTSIVGDVGLGAFDGTMRSVDMARANEANRAWEIAQAAYAAGPLGLRTNGVGFVNRGF